MPDHNGPLGPIKLKPTLHETIWGGNHLTQLAGKAVPAGAHVGESWETETGNVALGGPYEGMEIGALVRRFGVRLLGERAIEVFGERFPLLTKFIDANDKLSVQVHPNDAYASEHEGGKLGKTEAWYILHAEPGAQLVYGLERAASAEEVRQAIAENRLEALLHYAVVRPGDVVFVPAGTVHAIGAGIVLYEIQEYSDVTYRLYDYGRVQSDGKPRDLHVTQSLAVMRYEPSRPVTVKRVEIPAASGSIRRHALVGCRYFMLEEVEIDADVTARVNPASCEILTVLDGTVQVAPEEGNVVDLGIGETAVIPAEMGGYRLKGQRVRLLRSYVPLEADPVLRAWNEAQGAK